MKREFHLAIAALTFYTRIPCAIPIDHNQSSLNKASRYFPVIGYLVGLISFAAFWASFQLWSMPIAVLASLVVGVLTTGAFHEDGLADFFDGFGGGWTKARILEIMKDSRVGTYGLIATLLQMTLKFYALCELLTFALKHSWTLVALLFISYHALARATAIQLSFVLPYVREDELAKSKPIAKAFGKTEVLWVAIFGLLPLVALVYYSVYFAVVLLPLFALVLYLRAYFKKWIGGFTGDCLGAAEQLAEVVLLLSFLGVWKFM